MYMYTEREKYKKVNGLYDLLEIRLKFNKLVDKLVDNSYDGLYLSDMEYVKGLVEQAHLLTSDQISIHGGASIAALSYARSLSMFDYIVINDYLTYLQQEIDEKARAEKEQLEKTHILVPREDFNNLLKQRNELNTLKKILNNNEEGGK